MASARPVRAYRKHHRPGVGRDKSPDVIGQAARHELREAYEEYRYKHRLWFQCGGHVPRYCDPLEAELRDLARNDAYRELINLVWAAAHGRIATTREIAAVLGVSQRTIERYKSDFERGTRR